METCRVVARPVRQHMPTGVGPRPGTRCGKPLNGVGPGAA